MASPIQKLECRLVRVCFFLDSLPSPTANTWRTPTTHSLQQHSLSGTNDITKNDTCVLKKTKSLRTIKYSKLSSSLRIFMKVLCPSHSVLNYLHSELSPLHLSETISRIKYSPPWTERKSRKLHLNSTLGQVLTQNFKKKI